MYSEWASLSPTIDENINGAHSKSVLNKFTLPAGKDVATTVIKQLAGNLSIAQAPEPSPLNTDQEVLWCMDVICYGLSLPLSDHETIKDCVNVYCEWLTALHPQPKLSVPGPVLDDANVYARKIISHLHNLFTPRQGESNDIIHRQVVLCHRVLRTLQETVKCSQTLTTETWESLLLFFLAINEVLLAPPTIKDDVGDQLCERILSALFEVWLLACARSFPSPSLWKTFQEACAMWRHRVALIEQWNRVTLALTARALEFMYGPAFPELKILEEDAQLIPRSVSNDCIAQTWYRFLRLIGSPTALCCPQVISNTPQFIQNALLQGNGQDPAQHPCLLALPRIFLQAIRGIAAQVDAFLGIYLLTNYDDTSNDYFGAHITTSSSASRLSGGEFKFNSSIRNTDNNNLSSAISSSVSSVATAGGHSSFSTNFIAGGVGSPGSIIERSTSCISNNDAVTGGGASHLPPHSPTPPLQRRLAKSFSVAPNITQSAKGLSKASLIGLTSSRSTSTNQTILTPSSGPPSTSSFVSMVSLNRENRIPPAPERPKCNSILHLFGEWLFEAAHIGSDMWMQTTKKLATEASRRPSSMIVDARKGSISLSQPSSLTDPVETPSGLTIDKFESGKAEAMGALCRIFCAKKTGEEILPVYLARFYVALQQGLKITESKEVDETMASILYNSANLFRIDLEGIHVLLPAFVSALELVLPEKELRMKPPNVVLDKTQLRRSAINILISILVLPLHFQSLPVRELGSTSNSDRITTFHQLKPRLINILMNALQVETDAQNSHMLLGALLLTVQDAVMYEETETNSDILHSSSPPPVSDTNLLSSACSEKSAYSVASAASNSSYGANVTATMSHDSISLTMSDDFPAELLQDFESASVYDSAHALFVRATYLVCHRLISSWKTELNVSLAALELLSGLARMYIKESDTIECKRAVKWICDYICYQCSRPPPAHSKDLHSTIVAAFQCVAAWLMQHPYLLQDKECLNTVLEVVELGISGSKSVGKPNESVKLKDEKELKPVSMRCRDAAETLLTIILEQVGYFPNSCGPQSLSSLLDEVALIKHCKSDGNQVTHEQAVNKFKYFVTENSTVLALGEEPLGNDQDPQPTVTLLIRGPFGRHAWTLQLRHLPRSKSGTKYHALNPGRPVPMNEIPMRHEVEQKFFPDSVDRIPPCIADTSIPTLDQILQKTGNDCTKQLFKLLEEQMIHEKLSWAETMSSEDSLNQCSEETSPPVCSEFQAARLFLSHFGFLSISNDKPKDEMAPPQLVVLDTKKVSFANDLKVLDKMSPRTCDTVHVFYVRAGQTTDREIIGNMQDENIPHLDPHFWGMLKSMGWPVNINEHSGWTGNIGTSWRVSTPQAAPKSDAGSDGFKFNGDQSILYWADVGAEIAFVVPTFQNRDDNDFNDTDSHVAYERSYSVQKDAAKLSNQKPRTLSLDLDKNPNVRPPTEPIPPARRRTTTNKPAVFGTMNTKIFVVWLESFEDHITFPADQLLGYTRTGEEAQTGIYPRAGDCHIIFLHALNTGLLRVKLQGPAGRVNFATPLVDGMVLSKRVVGTLVRQTAYNMSRRRRLDNDVYQPPHVRRRVKVQEMMQKYKLDLSQPELLAHLFKSSNQ